MDRDEVSEDIDFSIKRLGKAVHLSPIKNINFTRDDGKIIYDVDYDSLLTQYQENGLDEIVILEEAGPREYLFFHPEKVTAGIVTCGGLCPGLNNVIRSLFLQLHYQYGIKNILGFRYGYRGICPKCKPGPLSLNCRRPGILWYKYPVYYWRRWNYKRLN